MKGGGKFAKRGKGMPCLCCEHILAGVLRSRERKREKRRDGGVFTKHISTRLGPIIQMTQHQTNCTDIQSLWPAIRVTAKNEKNGGFL